VLATGEVSTKNVLNRRHNTSAFAEIYLPIVRGVPGVQELNLSIAARYEDYSDFGETTDPKFGLTWRPIETLTARATYGTSFRAPSLVDTSEQIHNIFIQNLTDPASVTGVTRGIYHNGGRSTLQPEEATTWSVGLDWRPLGVLDGLSASVTYYDVDYTDRIDVVPNTALTNPVVYDPFIDRRPPPSDVAGNAQFNAMVLEFLANPDLQSPVEPVSNINAIVDGRRANLAETQQTGLDVNLAYAFNTSIGDWRVGLDAAKIFEVTRSTAPGITPVDVVDTFGNPVDLRARASVNWRLGGLSANLYFNYVDGYLNTAVAPNVEVDDYQTVDAALIYEFENTGGFLNGLSLSLTGQDIFDEEPPVVLNGVASWDSQNVSPLGRLVSFVVTKRW
jgi:iron complex outermembrane receptor protein